MQKIAVFPGSFDPFTLGHHNIVQRAIGLFDKIIIAIGQNAQKNYMFDQQQRKDWIEATFEEENTVEVLTFTGLTIDFCRQVNANYILRGLRNAGDFTFEKSIAQINSAMAPEIESVFLITEPRYAAINSSIVRDIIRNGGNASEFLPASIQV
jgi:pantetheine-phosphate adenylyltransferase